MAAGWQTKAIIQDAGTNTVFQLNPDTATSAWRLLTAAPFRSRTNISILNSFKNSGNQVFNLVSRISSNFTTTSALTGGAYELCPGEGVNISISENIDVYGFTRHTSTEPCSFQEYKSNE